MALDSLGMFEIGTVHITVYPWTVYMVYSQSEVTQGILGQMLNNFWLMNVHWRNAN